MLHSHEHYTYTYTCMQNHNDDTIKTSDSSLEKIYLSLYLKGFERVTKGFTVRGGWRPNRITIYWPPILWPQQRFFPVLLGCSTGQGYILIFLDWMHLLFTQVHFLFWQLGRGQYVTLDASLLLWYPTCWQ